MITPDTPWQKSSFSGANGNCLELTLRPGHVLVRESDTPGTAVAVRPEALRLLLDSVKNGSFSTN